MADPVRQTARTLAAARDEQVTKVVALVDAMPVRGPADALIAPLRDRLRRLRPVRVPRFGRVLFAPLDPVIVPVASWRGGTATVPRTALAPLESIVRRHLGEDTAAIEAAIAGPDPGGIARVEAPLWGAAADGLLRAAASPPSPAWAEAGLGKEAFGPICRAVASVLVLGAEIETWAILPVEADFDGAFAAARPSGAIACAMLGAVLFARLPHASAEILEAMASLAKDDAELARASAELAIDAILGQVGSAMPAAIDAAPPREAAREIQRTALLLAGLGRDAGPRRRERLDAVRDDLDAACRRRFAEGLMPALAEALRGLPAGMAELEALARDLRSFGTAAGGLGGSVPAYEAPLRDAAARVRALPDVTNFSLIDRVRVAEILAGPEEAIRLFALG